MLAGLRLWDVGMLTLEPERLKNQSTIPTEVNGLSLETLRQLAISVSQRRRFSPFFHRVSVMAAILRASLRRTMVGLMPLVSDAGKNLGMVRAAHSPG